MTVLIDVVRGRGSGPRRLELPLGSRVRDAVHAVGLAPEGSAVLVLQRPVPLDTPLVEGMSLQVVPTFSGG